MVTKRRSRFLGWLLVALLPVVCVGLAWGAEGPALAKETKGKGEKNPMVTLHTSKGDIVVELDAEKAPVTVKNFLAYVDAGFYDGTIFHRVIPGFMIQGGGFTPDMQQKPTKEAIRNEAANGLENKRGTIAMARTSVVDSATAQFFINLKDNDFLDHRSDSPQEFGYAVFGHVVKGMDVVDAIADVRTSTKGAYQDVPVDPVVIESARRD
jgi:peptidyl-prolyl cis-trans isomerase B (cyclophilin B)